MPNSVERGHGGWSVIARSNRAKLWADSPPKDWAHVRDLQHVEKAQFRLGGRDIFFPGHFPGTIMSALIDRKLSDMIDLTGLVTNPHSIIRGWATYDKVAMFDGQATAVVVSDRLHQSEPRGHFLADWYFSTPL